MNKEQILLSPIPINDLIEEILKAFKNNTSLRGEEVSPDLPELITRIQTAKELNISLVTLSDWTKKGILQSYNLSGKVYYKRSEIMQGLRKNKNMKYKREK